MGNANESTFPPLDLFPAAAGRPNRLKVIDPFSLHLLGQPELRDKLRMRNLEQFKQRIAIHYHLSFLDFHETQGYIKHRINIAT
jgi:type II secretory pathway predicted ATPase ExeA